MDAAVKGRNCLMALVRKLAIAWRHLCERQILPDGSVRVWRGCAPECTLFYLFVPVFALVAQHGGFTDKVPLMRRNEREI